MYKIHINDPNLYLYFIILLMIYLQWVPHNIRNKKRKKVINFSYWYTYYTIILYSIFKYCSFGLYKNSNNLNMPFKSYE